MKRFSQVLAASVVLFAVFSNQMASGQQTMIQPNPPAQNPYYFGLQVQLVHSYSGAGLRVVSVTPGGPACRAGLEPGDVINSVNGFGFSNAYNSHEGVRLMNSYVKVDTGIAPAAAAGAQTQFIQPTPQPVAQMVVRDVRTGGYVNVHVTPIPRNGGGIGGIAPAQSAGAGGR